MMAQPERDLSSPPDRYRPFLDRLAVIYSGMDQKYKEAAAKYGFTCTGCEDNCCLSRFYHYTLLEALYIFQGCKTLDPQTQQEIICRAQTAEADKQAGAVRRMCPLNLDGRCILYVYRPMICRLHGIPHELKKPASPVRYGPGCETFSRRWPNKSYFKFDRTPFYAQMAELEKELRQAAGITRKLKATLSEILSKGMDKESLDWFQFPS